MSAGMEYVVRCGRRLFLGMGTTSRAGSVERARRFISREAAETAAEVLRGRSTAFTLPWTVQEVQPKAGAA